MRRRGLGGTCFTRVTEREIRTRSVLHLVLCCHAENLIDVVLRGTLVGSWILGSVSSYPERAGKLWRIVSMACVNGINTIAKGLEYIADGTHLTTPTAERGNSG